MDETPNRASQESGNFYSPLCDLQYQSYLYMSEDDQTLILLKEWNSGDPAALNQLIERHLPEIRKYVKARLGNKLREKAETIDFVQDAMLEFLRYGPRFEVQGARQFRALLGKIVENVIRDKNDWYRAQRRDMAKEQPLPDGSCVSLAPGSRSVTRPSEAAERAENETWIRLALEMLEPEDRQILVCREYHGQSFEEIAGALGLQKDTARMRFNRALPKLASAVRMLRRGHIEEE